MPAIRIINAVVAAIVAVIVAGVLVYVLEASPDSWIAVAVLDVADFLVTPFRQLFDLGNNKLQLAINFSVGALAWVLIGALLKAGLRMMAKREHGDDADQAAAQSG